MCFRSLINNDSKNLVSKKIDERSMIIFQKNLKKGPFVKIKNLSSRPGIYKFLDKNSKILYIGKASNLKKRVSSKTI